MDYIIQKATLEDVVEIREFLKNNYFPESIYHGKMTYDEEQTTNFITEWIGAICVIARDSGNKMVGVFAGYVAHSYYKEGEFDVIVFYVHPSARSTGVGRMLAEYISKASDALGCGAAYTTSASGISEENNQLYTNLFKKYGWQALGTELVRFKGEDNE